MNVATVRLLIINGGLQIIVSSVLGFLMLVPMQPWGKSFARLAPKPKEILRAHIDWLMLAFMQFGAALGVSQMGGAHADIAAWCLVAGGWLNPTPYLWRAYGVNAFVLAGPPVQRFASTVALLSSVGILFGWIVLVVGWLT